MVLSFIWKVLGLLIKGTNKQAHHQVINGKRYSQKRKYKSDFKVEFYEEFDLETKKIILDLRSSIRNPSLSNSKKKLARKRLNESLVFHSNSMKRFVVNYMKFIKINLGVDVSKHLGHVIGVWVKLSLSEGPVKTLKLFKQLMDIYNRISLSQNFSSPPFLSLNSRGEPRILGPLLELSKGTFNERRSGLSAISVIKLVKYWDEEFSTETITSGGTIPKQPLSEFVRVGNYFNKWMEVHGQFSGEIDINRFNQCFKHVLGEIFPENRLSNRISAIRLKSDIHVSARSGPNGPSLLTWVLDHDSLNRLGVKSELYNSIRFIAEFTQNAKLISILDQLDDEPYSWFNTKNPKEKPINSRLSIKDESWGKRRVFAICDSISQSSLKGIHSFIFEWLYSLTEDGTFNQDGVSELVRQWTIEEGIYPDSADLSAASDSSPVDVQGEIVSKISGSTLARHWKIVVSDRKFRLPNSKNDFVFYSRGQPMGLLSSWAMLATWNHLMCRASMAYCGLTHDPSNPQYVVIGDDVVIKDNNVFDVYKEIVSVVQGVGISPVKGFHRENYNGKNPIVENGIIQPMNVAEVAKRIFCDGREFTIVPPDEVKTSLEQCSQFPELIKSLKMRGYIAEDEELSMLHSNSKLCFQSKNSLILATMVYATAPNLGVTERHIPSFLENIIWFKPEFDQKIFNDIMIKKLKGKLISSLLKVISELNHWVEYSMTAKEVTVREWNYDSKAQSLVIFLAANKLIGQFFHSIGPEFEKEFIYEDGSINWPIFKRFISSFQVVFELESLLFKEKVGSIGKQKRKVFANSTIGQAVRETIKELGI